MHARLLFALERMFNQGRLTNNEEHCFASSMLQAAHRVMVSSHNYPCVCPAGPLPPSWGSLAKLKVCDMNENALSGSLPGAWSGMAALEDLRLTSMGLTGGGRLGGE
jgi:hypothetical protein